MPRLTVNYFLLSILFVVASVNAAEQGEWGETSTAYTTIQISILPNILITDVTDIVLDINDRTQDVVFTQEFCVVGNTNADYVLTASGAAGDGSPFECKPRPLTEEEQELVVDLKSMDEILTRPTPDAQKELLDRLREGADNSKPDESISDEFDIS